MNYEKKRRLKSKREKSYHEGYFKGTSDVLRRFIESGILPVVNFELTSKSLQDFKNEYPEKYRDE